MKPKSKKSTAPLEKNPLENLKVEQVSEKVLALHQKEKVMTSQCFWDSFPRKKND